MAMTMMSSAVFARSEESDIDAHEDGHSHCICGSEHNAIGDHEDEDAAEFEAWEYTDSLPEEGGYYYLTDDVEIDETWYVPDGTVLCLNGFDIVMNADGTVIELEADYEFTLTDCSENQGNITHADEYKGRGVYISYTSEQTNVGTFKSYDTIFNMYGGNITENDWTGSNSNFQGAGVSNIGTFNMYGGSICKNTASNEGGGVYNNGIFNMYGGEIYENEALKGGGVYTTDKFYMSGGEITDNNVKGTSQDTTLGAWGGGVYVYLNYSVFEVSGNVKITGNTKTATNVKNNKVTDNNVCLSYSDDRVITLGDLDEDAKIGVSSDGLSKLRNGNIATVSDESALESYIDDGVLVSDDPAMDLYYEDGYIKLQMQELYDITLADTENGSYKVRVYGADVTKAAEGETIAIAATPDEDYVVDEVTYSDGINEYTTDFENNEYLFTMPAFDITVNVTFRDISNPFQVTYDANGGTGEVVDDGEYMYDTEAEVLSGENIKNKDDMERAARLLGNKYGCAVLLKGGHSISDADDLLYSDGKVKWFCGKRIDNPNTHGTGCTLSSAIASNLAKGYDLKSSIKRAKDYISGALSAMLDLGAGSGPMNHAFDLNGKYAE